MTSHPENLTAIRKAVYAGDHAALLKAVHGGAWTEAAVELVHDAVIAWSERAIATSRPGDESCHALFDLLGRLRATHGEPALNAIRPGVASEWRGIEQVLDERIAKLAGDNEHRDGVLGRKHVQHVLQQLRVHGGTMAQVALRKELKISESALSQVLTLMESAQLISRQRGGSDGRVQTIRSLAPETLPAAAGANARPHRGMELCYLPDSAAA